MSPPKADPRRSASAGRVAGRCAALLVCIGTALALGGAARTAAGPALSFAAAKHYEAGNRPCSMAIGELNGDGKPDVVTADCASSTVSVLHNRGDGTFEGKRDYAAGSHPNRVAIADLNADGKSDLVVASSDPSISVLFNQGAGTFEPRASYAVGSSPEDVLITDLNGDDRSDLVVKTRTGSGSRIVLSVLLNRGDGTFEPKRDYPLSQSESVDVALGDLNGDARPDLVVVYPEPDGFSVLLNAGDGSFQPGRDYEDRFAAVVAIGDLNGDRKPDLAMHENIAAVTVFLNRGDGTFRRSRGYDDCGPCAPFEPHAIAIADVNGDHAADLVTKWMHTLYGGIHGTDTDVTGVSVLLNKGDGTFSPARNYRISYSEGSLAIIDLNGDRNPDIAEKRSGVNVLLNRGNGSFEPSLLYPPSYSESADVNGDGRPDLVAANPAKHAVSVRLNSPGLCNVQSLDRMTVAAAKRRLGRVNCRVGTVKRAYNKYVGRGHVISQRPRYGVVLPGGAQIKLVVSRGWPRRRG